MIVPDQCRKLTKSFLPQNALRSSGFIFQSQQCEAITFLSGARLEVVDDAADRDSRAGGEVCELDRSHGFRRLQQFEMAFERMASDINTEGRLLRQQELRACPGCRRNRRLFDKI